MSEENNSQNSNPPNPENAEIASEIQKLQEQAEKFKNDYLYLRAEFENYKRNAIKERSDLTKYGGERLVRDLLEVVDNFDRALSVNVSAENFNTFKQGVDMTAQELKSLLQRHNVTEIPAHGAPFDPSVHEALSSEATDQMAPGHVVRVFKKPYKLHDKVIRPGQVVVAKKPE
ncbi:nucleotide exchange factor GrpE [Bdellovibrio bacteriovorus]|uniref:Protein GrpE n=1 Tax=Bdellovibrio bacteriovorus str. Tiberius TaxID=1069642 RepID=K7Z2S1_BDEBC|nr:nucleotide exchange factor GrpE [Bdellovibrio bacteriovorus]AFY03410.1 GrpE protein [Bdellovibrio bacteriovorus str. Tiberius]